MTEDYAIDWLNIELQLSEAVDYDIEEDMINEGIVTKGILLGGKLGAGAAIGAGKYVASSMKNYNPVQGVKNTGEMLGNVARSPLMRASFWGRLLNKLKELWQRFKNIISSIFKSNSAFVNTELANIDAVINKAMADNNVANKLYQLTFKDVYPYWTRQDIMDQIVVPPLNVNDRNMIQTLSDKNAFVNRYVRNLAKIDFQNPDCAENIKFLFRGSTGSMSVRFDQIAPYIRRISDSCKSTNALVARLQNEQRQNEQAANEAMRKLQELELSQNQAQAAEATQTILAIRNYISISQTILGCKETIVQERYMQSVRMLRHILFNCKAAATKQEIKNAEVARGTTVTHDPLEGKSAPEKFIRSKLDPKGSRKEIEVDAEYNNSLPEDKIKLEKEILQVQQEIQKIEQYLAKVVNKTKLAFSSKEAAQQKYMRQQLDLYKRRLAVLVNKYKH